MALLLFPAARSTRILCSRLVPPPSTPSFLSRLFDGRNTAVVGGVGEGARLYSTPQRSRSLIRWTPELDAQLARLHEQGLTWKHIGESLNIHPITCHRRYRAFIEPELSHFWTEKRLGRLRGLAQDITKSWSEIATELSAGPEQDFQISSVACQEQWSRLGKPSGDDGSKAYSTYFTKRHQGRLKEYVDKATYGTAPGSIDWETMAHTLFGDQFSAQRLQCQHLLLQRQGHRWTKKEDVALTDYVTKRRGPRRYDEQLWLKASKHLDGYHSPQDCKNRWRRLRHPLIEKHKISNSGNFWSQNELSAYWKAWYQFGNDWDLVAEAVRAVSQNRSRETVAEQRTASLVKKTPEDCKADFQFLQALSASLKGQLKGDLGKIAHALSKRHRKHFKWTKEQLQRLDEAVRATDGHSPNVGKDIGNTGIDWEAVAEHVGEDVTGRQCQYRWLVTREKTLCDHEFRSGRWNQKEVSTLTRALKELRLLGSVPRLPRLASKTIQQEFDLKRTTDSIRDKAMRVLSNSLVDCGMDIDVVQNKALASLQGLSHADQIPAIADADQVRPVADVDQVRAVADPKVQDFHPLNNSSTDPGTRELVRVEDDDAEPVLDDELSQTNMLCGHEEDVEDDLESRFLHPKMFISPGILKADMVPLKKRASLLAPRRKRSSVVTWQPQDEDKLETLVKKYGQSTLAWRLIGQQMSIPERKCKDKWRNDFVKQKSKNKLR